MRSYRFLAVFFLSLVVCMGLTCVVCLAENSISEEPQEEASEEGMGALQNELYTEPGVVLQEASDEDMDTLLAEECKGPEVVAVNAGKVVLVHENAPGDHGMGNTVILRHTLPGTPAVRIYSLYAHLESISSGMVEGQLVAKGALVGRMGASGNGDPCFWKTEGQGVHLHFELKDDPLMSDSSRQFWRFTPTNPDDFGYRNPNFYIGSLSAIDVFNDPEDLLEFGQPTSTPQTPRCLYGSTNCSQEGLFHAGINYGWVSVKQFDEEFEGSPVNNWREDVGDWTRANSIYSVSPNGTQAVVNSSASYNSKFTDFELQVRMRKLDGKRNGALSVMIRASGAIDDLGYPANGYFFQINKKGSFSVYRIVNGDGSPLLNWTHSEHVLQGSAWNTVKVVAQGARLYFYINGSHVWTGDDSYLSIGRVGLGVFERGISEFQVDWARLNQLPE